MDMTSMRVKKCLSNLEKVAEQNGSHKSWWTQCKGVEAWQVAHLSKLCPWYLSKTHPKQTPSYKKWDRGKVVAIPFMDSFSNEW